MDDAVFYKCRKCGDVPEPESHHKMKSCKCGSVMVDRGWSGSRVLWKGGTFDEVVEQIWNPLPAAHRSSA